VDVEWTKEGEVLSPASAGDPDSLRAWQPWTLEEEDGTLRMWYSGHDGTTGRILEAVRQSGQPWQRLGVAVDAGLAGDSDRYGVGAPCVVKVNEGYLMAYGGFDGQRTRIHTAISPDGHRWTARGTIVHGEEGDDLSGSTPCLVVGKAQWWLFYSGGDGTHGGRRAAILAAVSQSGGSWDRIGPVLDPEPGELAVSHPCVVEISRTLCMFYASENDEEANIALATSAEGVEWERRGIVLSVPKSEPEALAVTAPCIVRRRDGSLHLWYARRPRGDDQLAYSICAATFPGPWPGRI
jgi:predicted GH43/DUF377 family glycosyl hydrolase